jgi:hypothetical protein
MSKKKGSNTEASKAFTPAPAPSGVSLPAGYKTARVVTLPSLVLKEAGQSVTVKILDAIRVSQVKGKPDKDGKEQKAADICTIADVTTGEQAILLVPAVVKSNLERDYVDEGYVGDVFFLRCDGKRKAGQRYNDFTIIEVTTE